MDLLTLTLLAAHHPTACVRDCDDDRWHAACLLRFLHESPGVSVYRHDIHVVEPYGDNDLCYGHGSSSDGTMTTAPEGPWTR